MNTNGKILALTSSKGGVGKTHLAVSLSATMAKKDSRVLLIDADLGNGVISDRLHLYPKYNLTHFFLKEKALEELVEQTPYGFFLIGGERGNFLLANLNYLQKMRFLRAFIKIRTKFDFVVLDLASGITRQVTDFALLAGKTVIVGSPNDLISIYGSVRACFSRFIQLESRLSNRVKKYKARWFLRLLILMNNATDFSQAETAFEAIVSAVDSRFRSLAGPFRIKLDYLGAVPHDPGLFRKSEKRGCPASAVSVCSKVGFCIDSIAGAISTPVPFNGFTQERWLRYTLQVLMRQQEKLRKAVGRKVIKTDSVGVPSHH